MSNRRLMVDSKTLEYVLDTYSEYIDNLQIAKLKELLKKEMRFVELKKKLGCTAKVLTNCLKELEEDGLVVREKDETAFNRVEYYLTDIGYTLRPVVDAMQKWGREYKRLRKLMDKYKEN